MERTIPYWTGVIEAEAIESGRSVLVASSENAGRAGRARSCSVNGVSPQPRA